MNYLEFEEPIRQLREQLTQARDLQEQSDVDMESLAQDLESKIREVTEQVYSNLTPWQRVQVSRHPDRPYTLNYIEALTEGEVITRSGIPTASGAASGRRKQHQSARASRGRWPRTPSLDAKQPSSSRGWADSSAP